VVIVAGKVYVTPEHREEHLASLTDLIGRARAAPGCLDLVIAADPLEPGRVNIMEQWESEEHLAEWASGGEPAATRHRDARRRRREA